MNTLTFTYTKADATTSKRVFYPLVHPSHLYGGIDISVLEVTDQIQFIDAMEEAKTEYQTAIRRIRDEFDLNQDYRQFDPKKMTDVVAEDI